MNICVRIRKKYHIVFKTVNSIFHGIRKVNNIINDCKSTKVIQFVDTDETNYSDLNIRKPVYSESSPY